MIQIPGATKVARDQNMGICRVLGYSMVLNSAPWVQMGKTPASALTMRLQTILHQWVIVDVDVALRIHCHAPCKRKPKRLLNIPVSIIQSWILRGSISGKSMRTRDCNQIASWKATAYSCRPFLGLMLRSSCPAIFITATATVWTCPEKNTGKAKNSMANRSHDILSKEKIGCCSKVVQDNLLYKIVQVASMSLGYLTAFVSLASNWEYQNKAVGLAPVTMRLMTLVQMQHTLSPSQQKCLLFWGAIFKDPAERVWKKQQTKSHTTQWAHIKFAYFTPISRTNHEAINESIYPPIAYNPLVCTWLRSSGGLPLRR